jgi:glyoxylase-like metal-dependent hydrolase (beta-lactamase superfamily II)
MTTSNLHVESLFDEATSTFSHLVMDRTSQACALIDSVLDYDAKSGRTSTASADRLIARVQALGARVQWLLETHVHADHLSARAVPARRSLGAQLAIGRAMSPPCRSTFGEPVFDAGPTFPRDGRQFHRLLRDGETLDSWVALDS